MALLIQFGREPNQVFHTFRHVDRAGMDRAAVTSAILNYFESNLALQSEARYTGQVSVEGVDLEFRAFQLPDGTINVGRITVRASGRSARAYGG